MNKKTQLRNPLTRIVVCGDSIYAAIFQGNNLVYVVVERPMP
jgi:hypothetical protein